MNRISQWTQDKLYGMISRTHLSLFKEQNSLCTFLFHGLFTNKKEIEMGLIDPQQGITIEHFREFVNYYVNHGYVFITPDDIILGLQPGRNYALITFDDGYYNNHLSYDVLKEYNVPATYLVSTGHVLENKCFWWDVVYRERSKQGVSSKAVQNEYNTLKQWKNQAIENYLVKTFGSLALRPVGDIDRPFTPNELTSFSQNDLVNIGNHTCSHAILTNYSGDEIYKEIVDCQESLSRITTQQPTMIAYPNGNYSEEIITLSKKAGLRLGITVRAGKNYLPLSTDSNNLFQLNRFTLWGNQDIRRQCEFFRTDIRSRRLRQRFNKWSKSHVVVTG